MVLIPGGTAMIRMSKLTDYAILVLAYLAEARERELYATRQLRRCRDRKSVV